MLNNVVVKSHNLMKARDGLLTHQHKLLGLAVSKLNPHKNELEEVEITFKEFCHLSGTNFKDKNYQNFYRAAKRTLDRSIEVKTGDDDEWYTWPLCSQIYGKKGRIKVQFNENLKTHLIQIRERFSKIGLSVYFQFKKDYSMGFYEILNTREKQAPKVGKNAGLFFVDVTIDDIRKKFQLGEKYKQYRDLKRRVILSALNEINDFGNYRFIDLKESGWPVERVRIYAKVGRTIRKPKAKVLAIQQKLPLEGNLREAQQKWPHIKIKAELRLKTPSSIPDNLWLLKHDIEIAKINGKYLVTKALR